jgi:FAD/FMN-containing dehydrogenase
MSGSIRAWAEASGVEILGPADYTLEPQRSDRDALLAAEPGAFDPRDNPCVDFDRLEERIPAAVLRPRDVDQLAGCMRALRERGVAYKIPGGQVLSDGGAVIDTRHLARIVDDSGAETITAEGGALWLDVCEHLVPRGRWPLALTDQLRVSVAGTLSAGGFCDTGHLHGLQLGAVTALTAVTPTARSTRSAPATSCSITCSAGSASSGRSPRRRSAPSGGRRPSRSGCCAGRASRRSSATRR